MAVWSEILLSGVGNHLRTEAEYYKPEYLAVEKLIDGLPNSKLSKLSTKITDGTHFTPVYKSHGVRFYSAVNVKEGYFYHENQYKYISPAEHKAIYKRCPVEANDVLLRKVGVGPRWSCVVPHGLKQFSIFVSVALIKCKPSLNPHYLSTFINTKYGQNQLLRLNKGISQPDLHLEDIGELKVPDLSEAVQADIGKLVERGLSEKTKSNGLYRQAQQLLESELGLDKLKFEKPVGYEASFSEVADSVRLDAQHYRPEHSALISHIKKGNWRYLRQLRTYNRRGVQPVYVEGGPMNVVNSQHIGRQHLDYDNFEKTSAAAFHTAPEAHIKEDDLLVYTTGAYIGSTNIYLSPEPALASNHVNILRLDGSIDPAYMAMVMQSKIGQFQTARHSRGSAQAELYPSDIDKFVVPLVDEAVATKIGSLVRESLSKQQESKQLLEQAKTRVEQLIEEAVIQ